MKSIRISYSPGPLGILACSTSRSAGVFKNFVQWTDKLTVAQYATINDGACVAYPIGSRLAFPSLSHTNELAN